MQASQEIVSCIKNIKYYTDKVKESVKQQLELDWSKGEKEGEIGKYSQPEGIRFMSLACITSACEWIKLYCQNIEVNLRTAEGQDSIFGKETDDGIQD